jgi:hypothetical protein
MVFQISSQLSYGVTCPSTVLLSIHALSTNSQKLQKEQFTITPELKWEEFPLETGQNRYIRLETGTNPQLDLSYTATVETNPVVVSRDEIQLTPVGQLDRAVIPYLFPSRYCQSDRLGRLATQMFGSIQHPLDQVTAIADWIYDNVDYISGTTDAATSAFDTVTQGRGLPRLRPSGDRVVPGTVNSGALFHGVRLHASAAGFPRVLRGLHRQPLVRL